MATVYISSTFEDLKPYRAAAWQALSELRHSVIAMEAYVAADERPLVRCLRDVERCDFYIGLFAWRYGFVPQEANPEGRSITELEYRRAAELGKACLIFVLDKAAPWPPVLMDSYTGENRQGERIGALRAELAPRHLASFFATSDDLARKVTASITNERRFDVSTPGSAWWLMFWLC